jgi:hypothetical protein
MSIYDYIMVVLGYDDEGLTFIPGEEPFNTLEEMGTCFGYWIKSTNGAVLSYPGWNVPPPARLVTPVVNSSDITPSRTWVSLYGSNITLDGDALAENSRIEAYTTNGNLCGRGVYSNGLLKFAPVYGYDETDQITASYPKQGDKIFLHVNGEAIQSTVTWSGNGDRIRIERLLSSGSDVLPTEYALQQNYPNPFNPSTEIKFSLPEASQTELVIFNVLGQKVRTLIDGQLTAGEYQISWDGKDADGKDVSSGLYLYRLKAGESTLTRKMVLAR